MLLQDRLKNYRLILASASPRRRELLAACDIDFTLAEKFECEECYPADLDAERMLKILSGATHKVVTGVTLRTPLRTISFSAESLVTFRTLENEEIEYYIEKYRPLDKAGAYGIQEWIGYTAIERIEGSFYNVMGLPVQRLYTALYKMICDKTA